MNIYWEGKLWRIVGYDPANWVVRVVDPDNDRITRLFATADVFGSGYNMRSLLRDLNQLSMINYTLFSTREVLDIWDRSRFRINQLHNLNEARINRPEPEEMNLEYTED